MPVTVGGIARLTDEELLARFRSGDVGAFSQLVKRYERSIYGYLRRYLGSEAQAEDVFQNTFVQVFQKAEQFDPDRRVKPWLYAIATHQAIDAQRRQARRPAVSLDHQLNAEAEGSNWSETLSTTTDDPFAALAADEQRTLVRQALDTLPPALRATVILAYYQELPQQEVAEILAIPVGTVKSRLHTALRRLRDFWLHAGWPLGDES